MDIGRQRLRSLFISRPLSVSPEETVRRMVAVQSQDYPGGLWAVGLRTRGATEADVERALAEKKIVRTWPMRGTLHIVAAADVRWMLRLLAPRIVAGSAGRVRQLGLDEKTFSKSRALFTKALDGGRHLSRNGMYRLLEGARISPAGQRGIHILWRLAQEGLLCFGAREGVSQTFVLLDEWVSDGPLPGRDEALALLAERYFISHGPATVKDFAWWSGLRVADATKGLQAARGRLVSTIVNGDTYWLDPASRPPQDRTDKAYLLPPFDEFLVGYRDRAAVSPVGLLSPTVVVGGRVKGTWSRLTEKSGLRVEIRLFPSAGTGVDDAAARAVREYQKFRASSAKILTSESEPRHAGAPTSAFRRTSALSIFFS
jgi:hypothetical protein